MLKQGLYHKLSQKLSPQQIQLMKLVQLPTVLFEQRIKEELEENPALDDSKDHESEQDNNEYEENNQEDINIDDYLSDDEASYKSYSNNYSEDSDEKSIPYAGGISFNEYLKSQLSTFKIEPEIRAIAEFLIGCMDDDGYIRRDLKSIANDLAFTQNTFVEVEFLEAALVWTQKLDPIGVGARNLQECLSIQLHQRTKTEVIENAIEIIDNYFESFTKKHFKKIIQKLDITEDDLKDAMYEISRLNPKPGKAYSGGNTKIIEHITPDFTIQIVEGELELILNSRNRPQLRISNTYKDMFQTYKESKEKSKKQKEAVLFVKQKLDSAKWFIDTIKQRENTLTITMTAIMQYQRDYFLTGDETMIKPMILKDIAEIVEMDISTISRVANSKYVSTPYGTFLIKEFFSESMTNTDGEEVSTREIKKILQNAIDAEYKRKPLTDQKLSDLLKEKGYKVARRTVAKYREQLNIPVARLRKEL